MTLPAQSGTSVLQLRIELLHITPLIWRRIQVPATYTFWDLHVAIQSAMGWNDSHLHEFEVSQSRRRQPLRVGLPLDDEGMDEAQDPPLPGWEVRVADYLTLQNPIADYSYDFGDDWEHCVILEEVFPAPLGTTFPKCTSGERASPPDDCGGPHGYAQLLEILADKKHPEHAERLRWVKGMKNLRGAFDPKAFDERSVRFADSAARLKRVLVGKQTG